MACNSLMNLTDEVRQRIESYPIPAGSSILVGYSGGGDSTALLTILSEIKKSTPETLPKLFAVYVDHRLRSEVELNTEFMILIKTCVQLSIPLIRVTDLLWKSAQSLEQKGFSTEERARSHRTAVFARICQEFGAGGIFLAHHEADYIETLLHQFFSGRAPDQIHGMEEMNPPYFRPLLFTPREKIENWLIYQGTKNRISWHEDSTNTSGKYLRNKLRNDLIPLLKTVYPGMVGNLIRGQEQREIVRDFITTASDDFNARYPWSYDSDRNRCEAPIVALDERSPLLRIKWITKGLTEFYKKYRKTDFDSLYGFLGPSGMRHNKDFFKIVLNNLDRMVPTVGHGIVFKCEANKIVIESELAPQSKRGYLCVLKKPEKILLPINPYSLNPKTIGDTKLSIPVLRNTSLVIRFSREGETVCIERGMTKQISKLWNEYDVPIRLRDFSIILEQAGEKNTLILFLDERNPMLIPLQGRIFAAQKPKLVLQMELRYGVTE